MEVASEFVKYSYKVDRLSEDILPTIVDADNHYIDALRYALQPMIKRKGKPKLARVIGA
jgi:phage terminase large subunit